MTHVTVVTAATHGYDKKRHSRALVWVLVVCMVTPALVVGATWVSYKKPWLMDDYRAGYAAGTREIGEVADPNEAANRCAELMGSRYGSAPKYVQYDTSEPASAFWWGCNSAVSGGENEWWNVSGYLTA